VLRTFGREGPWLGHGGGRRALAAALFGARARPVRPAYFHVTSFSRALYICY
jgi:hypothetical protein